MHQGTKDRFEYSHALSNKLSGFVGERIVTRELEKVKRWSDTNKHEQIRPNDLHDPYAAYAILFEIDSIP